MPISDSNFKKRRSNRHGEPTGRANARPMRSNFICRPLGGFLLKRRFGIRAHAADRGQLDPAHAPGEPIGANEAGKVNSSRRKPGSRY